MALTVAKMRGLVQHFSFLILMYGGRLGIHLGPALPCFACPFVSGCGGYCYLMGLQGYIGFGMGAVAAAGAGLWIALGWLAVFIALVAVFGKLWCGWVCPFGLLSDWLTALRRRLGLRERTIYAAGRARLAPFKYIFLALIVVLPPLVSAGILPEDFYLPFCGICPGKSLLPLFVGETRYLALNFDNAVTLGFSLTLQIVTGATLMGLFFKERFFCIFCPLLALIHLLKPLTALRLVKEPAACLGCGSCRRSCPMDIAEVEKKEARVQTAECLDCAVCAATCPSSGALSLRFLNFKLFASSRSRVARAGASR